MRISVSGKNFESNTRILKEFSLFIFFIGQHGSRKREAQGVSNALTICGHQSLEALRASVGVDSRLNHPFLSSTAVSAPIALTKGICGLRVSLSKLLGSVLCRNCRHCVVACRSSFFFHPRFVDFDCWFGIIGSYLLLQQRSSARACGQRLRLRLHV